MPKSRKECQEHFWKFLRLLKPEDMKQLGDQLKEYVEEASYGGWDGFTSHDQTGIWRFLDDFATYYEVTESERNCDPTKEWRP